MQQRLEKARERYVALARALAKDTNRPARFFYNKENDSRWETDKARFDPW